MEYELYHHGIKGMKWGVRRYQNEDGSLTNAGKKRYETSDIRRGYDEKKSALRSANKAYARSFNKAYSGSIGAYSLNKKHRQAAADRWTRALDDAAKVNDAKAAYKSAKKTRNQAINSTARKLEKQASIADKLVYNTATRRQAAKYVVDNNMSVSEATKKANAKARRNTAIFVGAYAAVSLAALYGEYKMG